MKNSTKLSEESSITEAVNLSIQKIVKRLTDKSQNPADWKFENLTEEEREILSEKEFENIKQNIIDSNKK